jgi:hypothetical protein
MLSKRILKGITRKLFATGFALVAWHLFTVMFGCVVAFLDEKPLLWVLVIFALFVWTKI